MDIRTNTEVRILPGTVCTVRSDTGETSCVDCPSGLSGSFAAYEGWDRAVILLPGHEICNFIELVVPMHCIRPVDQME